MAKHSFIVTLEVSDTSKESVKRTLTDVIENWLFDIHTITRQSEKLESVSIITKVEGAKDRTKIYSKIAELYHNYVVDVYVESNPPLNNIVTEIRAIREFAHYMLTKIKENGEPEYTGDNTSVMARTPSATTERSQDDNAQTEDTTNASMVS